MRVNPSDELQLRSIGLTNLALILRVTWQRILTVSLWILRKNSPPDDQEIQDCRTADRLILAEWSKNFVKRRWCRLSKIVGHRHKQDT